MNMSRDTVPQVTAEDKAALVRSNSLFGLDMYQELRSRNGNLAFSPCSLSIAMAVAYAGAKGDTESQMAKAVRYGLPQDRLHPAFNGLSLDLVEGSRQRFPGHEFPTLKIANGVWCDRSTSLLSSYLDIIARNYGAAIHRADFVNRTRAACKQINGWVSRQTEGKIHDLVREDSLKADTSILLANALYFKGAWSQPFDPRHTRDAPFYLLDGSKSRIRQMANEACGVGRALGDGWQAIELPYVGHHAAMDLIVPDKGRFLEFESRLDMPLLEEVLDRMRGVELHLALPRFTVRSSFEMAGTLSGLGMADAFNRDRADFSGMTGTKPFFMSEVVHQAFVSVDECGTEAAAATFSPLRGLGSKQERPPEKFIIDRPFIFVIRAIFLGRQILFFGRVLDPSK